jgi:hypothetical protein
MDAMHDDMLCIVIHELGFLICVFYPRLVRVKGFL